MNYRTMPPRVDHLDDVRHGTDTCASARTYAQTGRESANALAQRGVVTLAVADLDDLRKEQRAELERQ